MAVTEAVLAGRHEVLARVSFYLYCTGNNRRQTPCHLQNLYLVWLCSDTGQQVHQAQSLLCGTFGM